MPSHSACRVSAAKRASGSSGTILAPPARWSRYSRITGESYSTVPFSTISAGILPSGFCLRNESPASVGSAFSIVTSLSKPRMPIASLILRPNGEGGEERRIIIFGQSTGRALSARQFTESVIRSAGDHQVHGLRALALLVRLDVEREALTFVERFHAGALHRRVVHEHVASAVVGLDEPVAALAVEELHHST